MKATYKINPTFKMFLTEIIEAAEIVHEKWQSTWKFSPVLNCMYMCAVIGIIGECVGHTYWCGRTFCLIYYELEQCLANSGPLSIQTL